MTPQIDQAKSKSKYFSMNSFDAQQSERNVPNYKRSESKIKHRYSFNMDDENERKLAI